jgi:hypothetical protein
MVQHGWNLPAFAAFLHHARKNPEVVLIAADVAFQVRVSMYASERDASSTGDH